MEGGEERVAVVERPRQRKTGVAWGEAQEQIKATQVKIETTWKTSWQLVKIEQEVAIYHHRDGSRYWQTQPVYQATGRFLEEVVQEEPCGYSGQRRNQEVARSRAG